MENRLIALSEKVFNILNSQKYLGYWFPKIREIKRTGTLGVFRLITHSGVEFKLQIVAGYRRTDTEKLAWDRQTILVSDLFELQNDPEALCEKIHATFRAYKKYWETKDKKVGQINTPRQQKEDAIEMQQIMRIQALARVQNPSWFEEAFFGISSHHIYTTRTAEEILELRGPAVKRDELQKKMYNWNPTAPGTDRARRLFKLIQDKLPDQLASELRFYCMLASRADRCGGTDLLIACSPIRGRTVRIDLTANPYKQENHLALILRSHYYLHQKLIEQFASRVASQLQGTP